MLRRVALFMGALGVFAAFGWTIRLSQGGGVPKTAPRPAPAMEEISRQARAFEYRAGKPRGTLNMSLSGDIQTLNRVICRDANSSGILSYLYEGLLGRDLVTWELEPRLAAEMPASSDGGLTWIVKLRPGAQWFDGRPVTADDVVFTFEDLYFNPRVSFPHRAVLMLEVEDPATGKVQKKPFKTEKIDDATVRFTLPAPFSLFLESTLTYAIYPKHALQAYVEKNEFNSCWDISTDPKAIIGCGPFRLDRIDISERYTLVRNPTYWRKDPWGNRLPYLDRIVFQVIPNEDTRKNRFLDGSLDISGIRAKDFPVFGRLEKPSDPLGFHVTRCGPASSMSYLTFNMNRKTDPKTGKPYLDPAKSAWFRELNFRRAVSYAVNRDYIINAIQDGLGLPVWSFVSPRWQHVYTDEVRKYPYNLDEAARLLTEAGFIDYDGDGIREFPKGVPVSFTFTYPAGSANADKQITIVLSDLRKIGIEAVPRPVEFNKIVQQLTGSWDWEGLMLGFTSSAETYGQKSMFALDGGYHMWNMGLTRGDPDAFPWEVEIDGLFRAIAQEMDPAVRTRDYHKIQALVAEHLPLIYLPQTESINAYANRFMNVNLTPYSTYDENRLALPQ